MSIDNFPNPESSNEIGNCITLNSLVNEVFYQRSWHYGHTTVDGKRIVSGVGGGGLQLGLIQFKCA